MLQVRAAARMTEAGGVKKTGGPERYRGVAMVSAASNEQSLTTMGRGTLPPAEGQMILHATQKATL